MILFYLMWLGTILILMLISYIVLSVVDYFCSMAEYHENNQPKTINRNPEKEVEREEK